MRLNVILQATMKTTSLSNMKLRNLFETLAPEIIQAEKNHLVLDIGFHEGVHIFIISNVPRISNKKFQKLYDISFEPGSVNEDMPIPHRVPYGALEKMNVFIPGSRVKELKVKILKWNEFVETMKTSFPPEDDFDE